MPLETLQKIIDQGIKLTPMMEQYYSIKKNFPDTLLLFRMGDFYELFFEDAIKASQILSITLTQRGKIGKNPIPMSGIPYHAANNYIDRITKLGLKAAICEQVEDPKEACGIVKRAVTQIVSPGMPYDIDKAETNEHQYMFCGQFHKQNYYLTVIDFTTGDFKGIKLSNEQEFVNKLRVYSPKEMVSYIDQWEKHPQVKQFLSSREILITNLSEDYFNTKYTSIYIDKIIPFYKNDLIIKKNMPIINAIGALAYYIYTTQGISNLSHIKPFQMISDKDSMKVTVPTLSGLEILPKTRERYNESLLGFFDRTKTAMGSRKLKNIFLNPSADIETIKSRQNIIAFFHNNLEILNDSRAELTKIRDIERIIAKISTNKATPSDLINLANAITAYKNISDLLETFSNKTLIKLSTSKLEKVLGLANTILKTINDEIGASFEKGNLIKSSCSEERDRLAAVSKNSIETLLNLENKYREQTGIGNLKIKSNNVAGYFIEVSKSHTKKVPPYFDRRQTLVNCERYITAEITDFEKNIIAAKEKLERIEKEIYKKVIKQVHKRSQEIQKMTDLISIIDVFQSFAWIALQENFSKPETIEGRKLIDIKSCWHPLIKGQIKDKFVTHDIFLDDEVYFGLITGPNMAGKTTVMREIAIIQFLTQIGSFVPAGQVKIGLCDHLFSRLGANDDIVKGQSTFMVEMTETAEILRHATGQSLIILDEVGRGTSTYDGLSIAWALVDHLIKKTKAITLFATHYHELIEIIDQAENAKNLTVETIDHNDKVQFLYNLIEGSTNQSFGIHVAKLAGLPTELLKQAKDILTSFEKDRGPNIRNDLVIRPKGQTKQLNFFETNTFKEQVSVDTLIPQHLQKVDQIFSKLDIHHITPMQALQKLYEIKSYFK